MDEEKRLANRVFQLEANGLDHDFNTTLDNFIDGIDIPRLSEEIKLLLRLYLYSSYIKENTSVGMKVYNMSYCDTSKERTMMTPSKLKLVLLAACNLLAPYLQKRANRLESIIDRSHFVQGLKIPWLRMDNVIMLMKTLSVINFFTFLRVGKYLTLTERMLGLSSVMSDEDYFNGIYMNRVQMELMYRETVWKALAEFLTSVVPLINKDSIKGKLLKFTGMAPKMSSELKLSEKLLKESNKCAICNMQPFNPYVIGCRHVFCYYCLFTKYLSCPDDGFACLLCKYSTKDKSNVQRYKVVGKID